MKQENIRNFSIIAHIDHGKSTLADRILEYTGNVSKRELQSQMLDSMDIERERGITIKLNAVQLDYEYEGNKYLLNLIDTPGHVDFSYEVSRSLAACEGTILVVDASQGIEAQTLANLYLAMEHDLTIIPVINKIDLPNADVEKVTNELVNSLGFSKDEIILTSAKTGEGIPELVKAIIDRIPSPKGDNTKPLQGLVFDSYFDSYKGVVVLTRLVNGKLKVGDSITFMETDGNFIVTEIFITNPKEEHVNEVYSGDVCYVVASIKDISQVHVGDTLTLTNNMCTDKLPGYKSIKPMVYSGMYPTDTTKFEELREALGKLKLNDASLFYEPETSNALGFGFRCGFLGILHMEVIKERIEREFKIDLITTSPSVIYKVQLTDGTSIDIDSPTKLPDKTNISVIEEPYVNASIFTPSEYIGTIMELCQNKRGIYKNMEYIDPERVNLHYEMPLSEIIYDFFDKLKSSTKGYASFDYEVSSYKPSELVKLDILLNGDVVDAFSSIVHKDFAYQRGRSMVNKLRSIIPRQLFEIPVQAAIGTKVIAREDIKALRKDVLAKCYGGDVSRKKKLLEKQKEGKKKMKMIGTVEIPTDAFLQVLTMEEE